MAKKEKKLKKGKKSKGEGLVIEVGNVTPMEIFEFSRECMITYATAVNLDRSVPDMYDGLKPVMRRALYAASQQRKGELVKSARVVGDTIGKYHPHGDVSTYGAMISMVLQNQPLLTGKGNWGNLVDNAAAYRYTNVAVSPFGQTFFDSHYFNKAVTDFVPNYDDKEIEPVTLPAVLPNVLINGTSGIGVGVTTNLPSFTVDSLVDVLTRLLGGETMKSADFAKALKPNLRWGGSLVKTKANREGWMGMFKSSEATVQYQADLEVDEDDRSIIIKDWPPGLNPEKFIDKVRALTETDKAYNSSGTLQFTLTTKKGYNREQFMSWVKKIQKLATVSVSYKINVTQREAQVDDGVVSFKTEFKSYSVPQLLVAWLKRRITLEKRSLEFRIAKQTEAIKYTELLLYATTILKVIFASLQKDDSAKYIAKNSKLSVDEANVILELKVRQLSKLDKTAMQTKLKEQKSHLKELEGWLAKPRKKIAADLQVILQQIRKT